MSVEALNWARRIYVGDAYGKSVLRALADYANDEGYCFPSLRRLAEDCDLSIASVRRRIKLLEDAGLISTFRCWADEHGRRNYEMRGRETTRDIRLPLSLVRTRPIDHDDAADDGEDSASTPLPNGKGGESACQVGGGDSGDRGGVALESPPSEPPSNEESPPNPPPGGGAVDEAVRERFKVFFAAYPDHRVMDEHRALQFFAALTAAERELAVAAVPHLEADLRKAKRKPKDAYKWLRDRGFDQYQFAQGAAAAASAAPVWVDDPGDLKALRVVRRIAGQPDPYVADRNGRPSVRHPIPIGDDLRALAAFADDDPRDWILITPDSREFSAWRHRIHDWTGRWVDLDRVVLRHGLHTISFPGLPDRQAQNRERGMPVPRRWPPRKDGTFSEEGDEQ